MHPVIRILCFLTLISALARANFPFILLVDGLFFLLALVSSADIFAFSWRLIRRMRWFWLSIILLYTLMTPGGGQSWLVLGVEFSLGGLLLGLERCLALLTILLYFSLLIHHSSANQLQGAIYWLLQPLRYLGVPATRLSIRVALTMKKIQALQDHWADARNTTNRLDSWRDIPERIAQLIIEVFRRAEAMPDQDELTLDSTSPSYRQWLIFIVLLALIITTRIFTTRYL